MKNLVVVIGGVTSGVGKGVVCASLGYLLCENNIETTIVKYDGLLNYNFEQMNPYHILPEVKWVDEEVTVLADGGVVDSDLGVYERFTGLKLTSDNNIVNGSCLKELLDYQDKGHWRTGEVLAFFPHLTDIYKEKLLKAIADNDVTVLEVGGTVGDFESEIFLRSLSSLPIDVRVLVIQVSYLAYMNNDLNIAVEEISQNVILKPIKQSFHVACSLGLKPQILLLRSKDNVDNGIKGRLSKAIGLNEKNILFDYNVENIYLVPKMLESQGLLKLVSDYFGLDIVADIGYSLEQYSYKLQSILLKKPYLVAIIGNTESWGSYTSLQEAILAIGVENDTNIQYRWFKTQEDYHELKKRMDSFDAFIVTEGNENLTSKCHLLETIIYYKKPVLCISYGACILAQIFNLKIEYHSELILGEVETELIKNKTVSITDRHRRNFSIPISNYDNNDIDIIGCDMDHNEIHIFSNRKFPNCLGIVSQPEYVSGPNRPNKVFDHILNINPFEILSK